MASILVVDDDHLICESLEAVLSVAGHSVRTAQDGRIGLKMLSENCPDLIICDIMMPEVDGFELYRSVKKDHPATKFFAISGFSHSGDLDFLSMANAMGADQVFQKPVMPKDLLSAIDALN